MIITDKTTIYNSDIKAFYSTALEFLIIE